MKRFTAAFICGLCLIVAQAGWAGNLPQQINGDNMPSLAPMLEGINPTVVNIVATGRVSKDTDPFSDGLDEPDNAMPQEDLGQQKNFRNVGSGVIVSADKGYVITNAHLLEQAKSVTITLSDGRHFKAKIIGIDAASDVAILQIKAKNLTAIKIADSNKLLVGDFVVAIGNPFGLNHTVTSGIVSAKDRTELGIEGYENFIQTDASINPGNSGGALVNLRGELVGINTAILAPSGGNIGISFAIPSNMATSVMDQLIEHGKLGRGVVGIMIQTLTPELADALNQPNAKGAAVTYVSPNSPAAKVGVHTGDIIQKINQQSISTAAQVRNTIGLLRSGSKVDIELLRQGKPMKFSLKSSDPENFKQEKEKITPFLYGVVMKNFDAIVPNFGHVEGIQALHVKDTSPGWQAGLRSGDIIVDINGHPINTLTDLTQLSDNSQPQILLNVLRNNGALFLIVRR